MGEEDLIALCPLLSQTESKEDLVIEKKQGA